MWQAVLTKANCAYNLHDMAELVHDRDISYLVVGQSIRVTWLS